MKWIYLLLAIVFEAVSTTSMKLSIGFTKLLYSVSVFIFLLLSSFFLTLAIKELKVSIAYAIWSGIGMIFIAAIDFYFFKEKLTSMEMESMLFIIIGIAGLYLNKASV